MATSIHWPTKVINVLQSDLTLVSGTLYELDVNALRLELKDLEDSEAGMPYPTTHNHNTELTLSGVTYARSVEIINGYTLTFEDTGSPYTVRCVGANHNLADITNFTSEVSLIVGNSAGLQVVAGSGGASAADVWSYATRTLTSQSLEPTVGEPLFYKSSSTTTQSDPGAGKVRWNNSTQASATQLYIDTVTQDGIDLSSFVGRIAAGDTLHLQDKDDATVYQNWLIGAVVNETGWITMPVTFVSSGGGNIANNKEIILVVISSTSGALTPAQEERLARIEKFLRNKRITDPVTGVQTVFDDDSTTILGQGQLFEDVAGTTPYRGEGAERADRLA